MNKIECISYNYIKMSAVVIIPSVLASVTVLGFYCWCLFRKRTIVSEHTITHDTKMKDHILRSITVTTTTTHVAPCRGTSSSSIVTQTNKKLPLETA